MFYDFSLIGGVLIAADYSQLELRILAHLSQDTALLSALNSGQDVFKAIAARWKSCTIESVTDAERQQAKQVRMSNILSCRLT